VDKYRLAYIDTKDIIAFLALKIKEYYNASYKLLFFKEGDLIYLRLYKGYKVPIIKSKKIG